VKKNRSLVLNWGAVFLKCSPPFEGGRGDVCSGQVKKDTLVKTDVEKTVAQRVAVFDTLKLNVIVAHYKK
jgi:hypothetical protein